MKFWNIRSPLSMFASMLWSTSERLGVRCPFAHVVFGWMIGAKRKK